MITMSYLQMLILLVSATFAGFTIGKKSAWQYIFRIIYIATLFWIFLA